MIRSNQADKFNSVDWRQTRKSIHYTKEAGGPAFVLPEITGISEVSSGAEEPTHIRGRHSYKVHMVDLTTPLTFVFKNLDKATKNRRELIVRLIEFWESDKVLFSNGLDGWVTVISAIRGISDIFRKGDHVAFSANIANVDKIVDFHFLDNFTAAKQRHDILTRIDKLWIDRARECRVVNLS